MAAPPDDPGPKPRRLPRFSLRSLILFIALITSGTGLWYHWEPWVPSKLLQKNVDWSLHKAVEVDLQEKMNVEGFKLTSASYSQDRSRIATFGRNLVMRIWDARTLSVLAEMPTGRHGADYVAFSPDGTNVYAASKGYRATWHRRRPEYWWGIAWMPEFWLTVVLGGLLAWSLWRDRTVFAEPASRWSSP